MKNLAILLGLLLALALAVSPANAIVGGELDTEHINVGAIVLKWPAYDYQLARLCSGILIHTRALLTAAHCFTGLEDGGFGNEPLYVTFEQDALFGDPDEDQEYLAVDKVFVHPDFSNPSSPDDSHDIALVILKDPVYGIETEDLPAGKYMDEVIEQTELKKGRQDMEMIIVGYGSPDYRDPPERFTEDAERKVGKVTFKDLTPFEIRTYQNLENDVNCYGDSGGPLYHEDNNGNEVLVGIASWGDRPCVAHAAHYRVDTASAQDFIDNTINQHFPED